MTKNTNEHGYKAPLVVMTSLFFMWGFITCMNDILIPYLKGVFMLSHFKSMLVQFSFFGAYFVGSALYFIYSATKGDPINKIGYRYGIIAGLLISSVGCSLFMPAAELTSFGLFLAALFVLGLGFTLLQISANPYVAILGTPQTASGRLNLAQAFNSFGTTIAPVIGGFLIFKFFSGEGYTGAQAVKVPYMTFSIIFFVLALIFNYIKLPEFTNREIVGSARSILRFRQLKWGMWAIFMYVGAEVCIGSILISYLKTKDIAGLDENHASTFVAFYWGGLMIGRFIGGITLSSFKKRWVKPTLIPVAAIATTLFIMTIAHFRNGIGFYEMLPFALFVALQIAGFIIGKHSPSRTLAIFAVAAQILLIVTMATGGGIAMWSIIAVGLFNSIMWSNIFTLAIKDLGDETARASSLLIMMIVGGALLPLLQGYIADITSIRLSFIIPLIAYGYIAFYGLNGHKPSKEEAN